MALNGADQQRSMLDWSPSEALPKRKKSFRRLQTSISTRKVLTSSRQPLAEVDLAEVDTFKRPMKKSRGSKIDSSSEDDTNDGSYASLHTPPPKSHKKKHQVIDKIRYSFRERTPADYREPTENNIYCVDSSEDDRKRTSKRRQRDYKSRSRAENTRSSRGGNNRSSRAGNIRSRHLSSRRRQIDIDNTKYTLPNGTEKYPSRRRSIRLNPEASNFAKKDNENSNDENSIHEENEEGEKEKPEDQENTSTVVEEVEEPEGEDDDEDDLSGEDEKTIDKSDSRSRQLGEVLDDDGPRYSLRNRSKVQRSIVNVSSYKNRLRKSHSAFADYARRVEQRAESRRRHHFRNSRRRRHYGGSSSDDSSVEEDDDSDAAGFRHSERKRFKREINAILPINGFGPNGSNVKATSRSDVDPLEIDRTVTWESVGGLKKHIQTLKEMVMLPLLYPEFFDKYHVTPPCGILFYGAPGTGKTLLARALANSCSQAGQHVTFFMRKGADCLSKWVGEAERQLRLLFEQAKRAQPSIIFFDEIDGLAPVRSSKQDQIHASIVSTLLALMDGLDARGQVIVIGATNRVDAVDPALRRPGRFDRELPFLLPNSNDRRAMLDINTKLWQPPLSVSFKDEIAEKTVGYCGADIKSLCSEAVLNALRRRYPQVYVSQQKLVIDIDSVQVSRADFVYAMKAITPAAHRSASACAASLPRDISFLLESTLVELCKTVQKNFPVFQIEEDELESRYSFEEENSNDIYASLATNAECCICKTSGDMICCSCCSSCYHLNCIESDFKLGVSEISKWKCMDCTDKVRNGVSRRKSILVNESSTTHRARLLISGKKGMGQQYLGAALLHKLERFTVFSLDLPRLIDDHNATSPEQALIRVMAEARRCNPCILYIPQLETWWDNTSTLMKSTFKMLLSDLSSTLSILLIATANIEWAELDSEICEIFSASNSPHDDPPSSVYSLKCPTTDERRSFFQSVYDAAISLPKQTKRDKPLEVLPIASVPIKSTKPTEQELTELQAKDMHYLRELRVFLDKVLEFCMSQKRYAVFARKVDPEDVPDYYDIIKKPMDLETISEKLNDGEYLCFDDFLNDLSLIVKNAQEYNPKHSASRMIAHSACNMIDNIHSYAYRFIKNQGYDLFEKCKKISESIRRHHSKEEINAQIINIIPQKGLAKAFHRDIPKLEDRNLRSRKRLRQEISSDEVTSGVKTHNQSCDLSDIPIVNDEKLERKFNDTHNDSDKGADSSNELEENVICKEKTQFEIKLDMHVLVKARTYPGVNKLGGVGKITSVNEDGTYDVKYILGGSEKGIHRQYIDEYSSENLTSTIKMSRERKDEEEIKSFGNNPRYFASHIWPELTGLGWTRIEDMFYPPGITPDNGEVGVDIFDNSEDVLECVRNTPELVIKLFGKRYYHQNLDAKVITSNTLEDENTIPPAEESQHQEIIDLAISTVEQNASDDKVGAINSTSVDDIQIQTEIANIKEKEAPQEDIEQPVVIIDKDNLTILLEDLVQNTTFFSIESLQCLRADLHKIIFSYRKTYDRTNLTKDLLDHLAKMRLIEQY